MSNAARPVRLSHRLNQRSSLTVSFRRPRVRRRASTLRPFFVAIRWRKPWVFFLFRLCGWKVRFMRLLLRVIVSADVCEKKRVARQRTILAQPAEGRISNIQKNPPS
jgi:hypothetical protein